MKIEKILLLFVISSCLANVSIAMETEEFWEFNESKKQEQFESNLSETEIAILKAIEHGELGEVARLFTSDIDPNFKDAEGATPLHYAAKYGWYQIVEMLLQKEGIEIEAEDNYKNTPLGCAVMRVVKLRGSQKTEPRKLEFLETLKIIRSLLDRIPHPKLDNASSAILAKTSRIKKLEPIIKEMLLKTKDTKWNKTELLFTAIALVKNNFEFGMEILKMLIAKKSLDINKKYAGDSLAIYAVKLATERLDETFEILLETDIDLTATDGNGKTVSDLIETVIEIKSNAENRNEIAFEAYKRVRQMIEEKLAAK